MSIIPLHSNNLIRACVTRVQGVCEFQNNEGKKIEENKRKKNMKMGVENRGYMKCEQCRWGTEKRDLGVSVT